MVTFGKSLIMATFSVIISIRGEHVLYIYVLDCTMCVFAACHFVLQETRFGANIVTNCSSEELFISSILRCIIPPINIALPSSCLVLD